jgi:hypothetical protein
MSEMTKIASDGILTGIPMRALALRVIPYRSIYVDPSSAELPRNPAKQMKKKNERHDC